MTGESSEDKLRQALGAISAEEAATTSRAHDERVLAAARAWADSGAATSITSAERPARKLVSQALRWAMPFALAASFAAGFLVSHPATNPSTSSALVMPLDDTRGSAGRGVPVERANPDDWYHYIQELIAAGNAREAEQHLHRFNELHPDYIPDP